MKNQIDLLMKDKATDAILVSGAGDHNPAMVYLTGGGHFDANVVKLAGSAATIYCYPMEREEAARSGLRTVLHHNQKAGIKNLAQEYRWMLNDAGLPGGKICFYGRVESGRFFALLDELKKIAPEYDFFSEGESPILMEARTTKEDYEIERICKMGKVTTKVVGRVADLLTSRPVHSNHLLNTAGDPLKIGEVKRMINLWLAEGGAENPEGTIFSIGRDAVFRTLLETLTILWNWDKRSYSTYTPARPAEDISTTLPVPGAWVTPDDPAVEFHQRSKKSVIRW